MSKKKTDPVMTFDDIEKKVESFGQLLESIETTEDKKKLLWKEIYENALYDRANAEILFNEAYTSMQSSSSEHISLGPILTKYLERMNRTNEQLLKLAELVSKAEEQSNRIDPEDIFSKISE
ncbi:MAG TPA: hypothetical protein DCQ49_00590 [Methylophaga sp.]|nr:hypothetical protein [Methylophaga sp.]